MAILENEIEIARNIPYPDIGVQGGVPSGNLKQEKDVSYGGAVFKVRTFVKNIDDPFDGTINGSPADLIPADYKLVQIEVSCASGCRMAPINMMTTIAPKNLEKATKNGSLFINIFDASGTSVSGANVSIVNNQVSPAINLNDTTDINGSLNFVDIATSSAGYHIVVSKSGYSTDQTYPPGGVSNPNPVNPDATVKEQDLTKISFAIDRLSSLNFKTQDKMCKPIANIDFNQKGEKLIGTNPDVFKYSIDHQTDAGGIKVVNNLEWDTYSFTNLETLYDVGGIIPDDPLVVIPASSSSMVWVMEPKVPASLLVSVFDENDQPVADALVNTVSPNFSGLGYTGRSFFSQTDWSGNQFTSQSGKIETENPLGQLTISFIDGKYATSSEELISSTFDLGTSATTFYKLKWNPATQPLETGPSSLKFQVAANNDNLTWNFVGPTGNSSSYYIASDTQIHSSHNGKRYLRYKIFMQTQNNQFTPRLDDLTLEFKSSCLPAGQAFFSGLPNGEYTVTISKSGYEDTVEDILIDQNWQSLEANLFAPE